MFNENSGLVLVWLDLIRKDEKSLADVPHISNLYEVIERLVNADES